MSQRATLLDHETHDAQLPGLQVLRRLRAEKVRAIADAKIFHPRDNAAQVSAPRVSHSKAVAFDRAPDRGARLEPLRETGSTPGGGRRADFNLVEGHHHGPFVLYMFSFVNAENGAPATRVIQGRRRCH